MRNSARATVRAVAVPQAALKWFWAGLFALAIALAAQAAAAKTAPESFSGLAKELLPRVVNISTTQTVSGRESLDLPQLPPGSPFEEFFKQFFDRNAPQQRRHVTSLGSGFIVDKRGYIVTNNHVIQDADEITVILHDETRLKATLVGHDPKTDLAVLKVDSEHPLPAVKFGDSSKSEVGDWVVAIGNPFGLGGTVTAGIISARNRNINAGPYDDFLQTDASINRGNSGGPMFNLDGEVIGINTAIFSPSGGSVGIGFAIPSRVAEPVIRQLIDHGEVRRGWLGVHIQTVTPEIADSLGLKEAKGALVASVVDGGPADKGGIQAGDVITEFDGQQVAEMRELPRIVAATDVGKTVDVRVWRKNAAKTLKIHVAQMKEPKEEVASRGDNKGDTGKPSVTAVSDLGLKLGSIDDEKLRQQFNIEQGAKGVLVTDVDSGGPAAEKGIQPGDRIVEVSQEAVASPNDVAKKVAEARKKGRKSVLLLVEGQGGLRFVAVKLAG